MADEVAGKAQVSSELQLASDLADKALDNSSNTKEAADSLRNGAPEDDEVEADGEEEDEDDEQAAEGGAEVGADGIAKPKKKKKSKKKKKKKAVGDSDAKAASTGTMQKPVAVNDIPALLQQLALSQPKKEGKAPEDYKFWNTQPVPKFKEPNLLQTTNGSSGEALPEGAILPDEVCRKAAKPEPEQLLGGFEWCLVDLEDEAELQELYEILYNHYVEDTDGNFRFDYSKKFLAWALKPPGWKKDWHIGVRTASTEDGKKGKLVAFIAGTPATLKVRSNTIKIVEINFLTIHHKLRSERLAPVLIKEVTRRCYLNGIYQALYTAGTLLPTPVTTSRYYHRSLDWQHLYKNGFSHLPQGGSEIRQKYKYRLDSQTTTKGLRPMKKSDLPAVKDLLARYLERFSIRQSFDEAELEHWLCSDASKDVVWAFVVEQDGKITDFMSYYVLESTVLKQASTIRAAYLYYYASESAFATPGQPKPKAAVLQSQLQTRLQTLMHDILILAKKDNFHVFNALTILDNPLFLGENKFEPGDGKLHFYLFNWRTAVVQGGVNDRFVVDEGKMGGVGVVML
ncbi:glycylpeptide N-tetradecanoyltransferase [Recurvomyces mirabilis]|uniref:glycylpeptide N-tetradecanoyltransferase n=1 Tax=Recurvomyces mirabilis TaxID=574656 RepID=UPI002DDE570F|nr:glycylpeptide N-tetradecanoyltransferase [Recurvomyces mirabilis]